MSMIANKMDAVSVNRVWEEHVKKENRTLKLNEQFLLADPRKMDILPEKPNRTVPTQNPDAATMAQANATLSSLSAVKEVDKPPADRYALPVTGNMEYGFFARLKGVSNHNPQFDHKHNECDVTQYANSYAACNGGVGPYTTKLH